MVDRILELIGAQLDAAECGCETMLVVGGFAASPYLMLRINEQFRGRVPHIWQPPQSGSAIVEGAVLYGAARIVWCHTSRGPLEVSCQGVLTRELCRLAAGGHSCALCAQDVRRGSVASLDVGVRGHEGGEVDPLREGHAICTRPLLHVCHRRRGCAHGRLA